MESGTILRVFASITKSLYVHHWLQEAQEINQDRLSTG